MKVRVIVVGASVRAVADSAHRAGLRPLGLDWFADLDLTARTPALRLDPARAYHDAAGLADQLDPGRWAPVILAGALENHPDAVRALASDRQVLGSHPSALEASRDQERLARVLARAGLAAPEVATSPVGLPTDGSWLIKPKRSAGGRVIAPWTGQAEPGEPVYFQRKVEDATPLSALFVARGGGCTLHGLTRQWLDDYRYRGSIGPWPVPPEAWAQIDRMGQVLARELNLRGIFGIDLMLETRRPIPWFIELNPRYTASVEVLEFTTGRALLADHLAACGLACPPHPSERPRIPLPRCVAKLILTAGRAFTWTAPPAAFEAQCRELWNPPRLADLPAPGTRFAAGNAVCTLFAVGEAPEDGVRLLETAARAVHAAIPALELPVPTL